MSASPAADRNLLFDILALQLDFVTRDTLVAAMHAWVLETSRTVGEILVRQGELSQDRLQLIEALVQEDLKQHGLAHWQQEPSLPALRCR